MRALNLLLAFLLELAVLAAAAWWGATLDVGWPVRLLAGLGAPLLLAALWGILGSPKTPVRLPEAAKYGFQAAWFFVGGALLALVGQPAIGVALVLVWVVNIVLLRLGGRPA